MSKYGPALLSLVIAIGAVVGYFSLLRVPFIRNHPVLYLVAFALAAAIAVVATARAPRWPNLVALALAVVLLALGGYFNFVMARIPLGPPVLRVGQPAPDFTLPDANGAPVTLASFRGRTPVVVVFYRGYW
jgi:cytochrome oxidase Cu insertion factor (SCO1/SenC/PrrC family)